MLDEIEDDTDAALGLQVHDRVRTTARDDVQFGPREADRRAAGAVDADDVGAEVGQHHRRERTRPDAHDLDDADAGQRPRLGKIGHPSIVTVLLSRLSSGVGHAP
jgi:hypothetical protein